jgi:hypothetical protein
MEELQSTVSIAGAIVSMTLRKYVFEDSVLSKVEFEDLYRDQDSHNYVEVLYQLYVYVQGQKGNHDIVEVCGLERDRGTVG